MCNCLRRSLVGFYAPSWDWIRCGSNCLKQRWREKKNTTPLNEKCCDCSRICMRRTLCTVVLVVRKVLCFNVSLDPKLVQKVLQILLHRRRLCPAVFQKVLSELYDNFDYFIQAWVQKAGSAISTAGHGD